MTKTFVLGLGAQKAGTTWVYQFLREHPDCAMGNIKEMGSLSNHFGARANTKRRFNNIHWLKGALEKFEQDLKSRKLSPEQTQIVLDRMENVSSDICFDNYVRYYSTQLQRKSNAVLTGDITPEYCMLSETALEKVKLHLEDYGYRVKAFFLMRDPVERCFSALRMGHRRALKAGSPIHSMPHNDFAKKAVDDWQLERTQYEKIIPKIENVFAPEDRYFGFFETFFTSESIANFCNFLEISNTEAKLGRRVNASPRGEEPSGEEWERVRAAYRETYEYCAIRFGIDLISDIWNYRA